MVESKRKKRQGKPGIPMDAKMKRKKHLLKPISLFPLTPEEALKAFMEVDPKKIEGKVKKLRRKR